MRYYDRGNRKGHERDREENLNSLSRGAGSGSGRGRRGRLSLDGRSRQVGEVGGAGDHELVHEDEFDEVEEARVAGLGGRDDTILDGQVPGFGSAKAVQLDEAVLGGGGGRGRIFGFGNPGSTHLPEVELGLSSRLSGPWRDLQALQLLGQLS